jgi:DNA-binding transcriptional MerR regulator/effector-binding domain-containing protein
MLASVFRIGEFARMGSVSVPSLRHYHERGLLVPAAVDPDTGYRWYSAGQLTRLARIVALKELGFTLDQIDAVIASVTASELRGMLLLRRTQIEADIAVQQDRWTQVEARLRAIEREGAMPGYEIVVKALPARHVAALGGPVAEWESDSLRAVLEPAYAQLAALLDTQHVEIVGPPFDFYVGDPEDGDLVAYAAIPIADSVQEVPQPAAVADLPAVAEALSVVVSEVTLDTFTEVYSEFARWTEEHGYAFVGAQRECLVTPEPPAEVRDTVLEIQQPVYTAGADKPAVDPIWISAPSCRTGT